MLDPLLSVSDMPARRATVSLLTRRHQPDAQARVSERLTGASSLTVARPSCPYDFDRFAPRCKEKNKNGACHSASSADRGGFNSQARRDDRTGPLDACCTQMQAG